MNYGKLFVMLKEHYTESKPDERGWSANVKIPHGLRVEEVIQYLAYIL